METLIVVAWMVFGVFALCSVVVLIVGAVDWFVRRFV